MGNDGTPEDGFGPEEVRVTIVVEPGRVRPTLAKVLASARVRARLACIGLIAAAVAATIIVASSSTSRHRLPPGTHSSRVTDVHAVGSPFGIRLNCPSLTLVSPDGAYARVDFEPTAACGSYGNHVTLILHRIHGAWVPEFEAAGWTCPMSQLPKPVVTELGLCGRTVVPARPVAPAPRGVL